MAVNRGLGRGLSALFSDTEAEYDSSLFKEEQEEKTLKTEEKTKNPTDVPLSRIFPNPSQPRKHFESGALEELSHSIAEHGILQPLLLCEKDGKYMIIAGERRYRAAKLAGLEAVPAIIKDYSEKEIKEISLIENLQREDLNAVESASALKQLMDEYGLTQEELSSRIGKSRSAIANLVRLLTLPSDILDMVRAKILSEGHARCFIGIEREPAVALARTAIEKGYSVRETERAVKLYQSGVVGTSRVKQSVDKHSRELKDLIEDMQRVFGTKVAAVGSDKKGRIYIDYYTADDLDRIFYIVDKIKRQ